MKIIHAILISMLLVLSSCTTQSGKKGIDSEEFAGTYTAELGPLWEQILEKSAKVTNTDSDFEVAQKMASLFLSSISIQVSFYENHQGFYEVNGIGLELLDILSEMPGMAPTEFEYEIRNDSVLYVRFINSPDMEYERAGAIEKVDGYKHIALHIQDCGTLDMYKKTPKDTIKDDENTKKHIHS